MSQPHSQVLFPLLEKVHTATREASTSSLQSSALLIHHTRDSAKKQWAETQVLTLSGTGEVGEWGKDEKFELAYQQNFICFKLFVKSLLLCLKCALLFPFLLFTSPTRLSFRRTARLFQSRWDKLISLPNFTRTWTTLLSAIKLCASSTSVEVHNPKIGYPMFLMRHACNHPNISFSLGVGGCNKQFPEHCKHREY